MPVQVPDDSDFSSFKDQCLSSDGWTSRYSRGGVTVWCRGEEGHNVQTLKMRIVCKDVMAETLYDVLHDTSYRRKWDTNMIDTYDIGRLTVNTDVGYYSWKCPTPLKNRDFVTMRSWLPLGSDFLIINYSVKHPKHPPKKEFVRAVSLLTGYLIQSNGTNGSTLYYLTQVDPKGHEEDLQGVSEVSRVEEEAQPRPEAVDVPGAEHAAVHQRLRADGAASRLAGEHRRERRERGEDASQRRRGNLNLPRTRQHHDSSLLYSVCWFV
ncbi:START domain-containing protein 10 isoform X1 [Scophthalmus maximus]|uniref:START domain-containing protein 10 isoform X1 n=1 Tax=Scophthalmus maximus TaxID=52904 RepID=UPI0015E151E8|nr:START domain-containing protein 10 isoform X1 [Scophthalmus maximus]XP_047190344.1 START domain-containing protein 10 isoform X1 [Scophthalmus maximus]XP_047190345.1 START domain-containing protein 10 isoform X1 [Scophthalmus maximus]